ncbi:MAG: lipopolysaccharide biosynthesis protein [Candidatus Limimorpha sp.]
MFKKILGTGFTRGLNTLCSAVTLWLGANYLGAAEWGIAALVQLDVSLLLIGVELLAGSGLVYYTPRKKASTLMAVSYSWIIVIMVFYTLLFFIFRRFDFFHNIVPEGYERLTLLMVFVYSFHNFNMNFLLGKEKVGLFNWVFAVQFLTQFCTFLLFIFFFQFNDARGLLYSMLLGYIAGTVMGSIALLRQVKWEKPCPLLPVAKELLNYGGIIQLSTLVHILNKRLSAYFLKSNWDYKTVGVYTSGTQISEGVKLVGHSISLVQFSSISNTDDEALAARLTVRFMKISVLLTIVVMAVFCILPVSFYEWIFTKEFSQIKQVILLLAPGIVMLSANTIFSHYFSGTDRPKYNLFASLIGLAVTIPCVAFMIPRWGIAGAAVSATVTYIVTVAYQWMVFHRITRIKLRSFIPDKDDWHWTKQEFKGMLGRGKKH